MSSISILPLANSYCCYFCYVYPCCDKTVTFPRKILGIALLSHIRYQPLWVFSLRLDYSPSLLLHRTLCIFFTEGFVTICVIVFSCHCFPAKFFELFKRRDFCLSNIFVLNVDHLCYIVEIQ